MNSSEHSQDNETPGCVVVIDDHADVRQLLACALEMAGFEVIKAGTELELQRILTATRPDALLIDMQRTPDKGLRLLTRMRRRQTLRDMPILFVASSEAERIRGEALRNGADWFAERPLSMIELQNRTVELVQRRRRARRQSRVS
jgi:two-component system phosphate regulon response regulator PhoB